MVEGANYNFNMINLLKEIDFSEEIEENKDLRAFIIEACKKIEQEESEALRKIKKPELDDELINQFISTSSHMQSTASQCSSQTTRTNSLPSSRPRSWRPRR